MALQDAIIRLDSLGVTDVLLPFALLFTIIYAVSNFVPQIKGKEGKKFRIVISAVLSLMAVIPHVTGSYPPGADVVEIINNSVPQIVMLIVAVFLTIVLISSTSHNKDTTFSRYVSWIRWIALIIVGAIFLDNVNFGYGTGFLANFPILSWFADPDIQALLVIIIVFGLIIAYVTGDEEKKKMPSYGQLERMGLSDDEIKDVLKGNLNK